MKKIIEFGGRHAVNITAVVLSALIASCSLGEPADTKLDPDELDLYQRKIVLRLKNSIARSDLIAKVLGSKVENERHGFMKFHIFGFAGDGNIVPFYTMNNYIIQTWTPLGVGEYEVLHREVAYYSKFDTADPIETWENPFTGGTLDLPPFVLGPFPRVYGPSQADIQDSFSSDPLNIKTIGDRVYVPTFSSFTIGNALTSEDWGAYSNGSTIYWDSMSTFSANFEDVFDESKTHVDAEMHMQNLISWSPFLKMGQHPGRTMVRACGQHISGFDDLPKDIRANFEEYTPEIFDVDGWEDLRMDNIDLMQTLMTGRAEGTLDIDKADYKPYKVDLSIDPSE